MTFNISKGRVALFVVAVAGGITAGYFGQPYIHENDPANEVIVTVFSILAGFLVAVVTLLGDARNLMPGSWRIASAQWITNVEPGLQRKRTLFYVYLITLGLVFAAMLVHKASPDGEPLKWLERVYLGLATGGFIMSLGLPNALMAFHRQQIEAAIDDRKKADRQAPAAGPTEQVSQPPDRVA